MPWPNYTQEEKDAMSKYLAEETSFYSIPKPKPKEPQFKPKRKYREPEKTETIAIPVHGGITGAFGGSAVTGVMRIKRKVSRD